MKKIFLFIVLGFISVNAQNISQSQVRGLVDTLSNHRLYMQLNRDSLGSHNLRFFAILDSLTRHTDTLESHLQKSKAIYDSLTKHTDTLETNLAFRNALFDSITKITDSLETNLAFRNALFDSVKKYFEVIDSNGVLGWYRRAHIDAMVKDTATYTQKDNDEFVTGDWTFSGTTVFELADTSYHPADSTIALSHLIKYYVTKNVPNIQDTINFSPAFATTPIVLSSSWTIKIVSISTTQAIIRPVMGEGTTYNILFIRQ